MNLVRSDKRKGVCYIQLNSPENKNALSRDLVVQLLHELRGADQDSEVRVIVLTGTGEYFCSGGDLKLFKELSSKRIDEIYRENMDLIDLFRLGFEIKTPLVTAVNGPALGGGVGLVAMSHLSIATSEAKFGIVELSLGIGPFSVWPWLHRALGYRKALELTLTGEVISAEVAKEIGLVNKVVPKEQLMTEVEHLCSRIKSMSPMATRLFLESIGYVAKSELNFALEFLTMTRTFSLVSEDLREGIAAVLEKRRPRWSVE